MAISLHEGPCTICGLAHVHPIYPSACYIHTLVVSEAKPLLPKPKEVKLSKEVEVKEIPKKDSSQRRMRKLAEAAHA